VFKVSYEWLKEIVKNCVGREVSLNEVLDLLNLQGFEVKSVQDSESDSIITIEVKANRPDMLCHFGVAREVVSFLGSELEELKPEKPAEKSLGNFPVDVKIEEGTCERFTGIAIFGIDNEVKTPDIIKKRLEILGVPCINAAVDLSNYLLLWLGQPTHIYDIDKLSGSLLRVERAKETCEFTTLGDKKLEIQKGDITISDKNGVACLAGIVGSKRVEVDENSKNIMIESAVFKKVAIRITSKRLRTSTLSSFRFERGVNQCSSLDFGKILAEEIKKLCGGAISKDILDYFPSKSSEKILLRTSRVNLYLGTELTTRNVADLLRKYGFVCSEENENVIVEVPDYRLDVTQEVDLIEETARSLGYDNIVPTMPKAQIDYLNNASLSASEKVRSTLLGLGFDEVVTYSFIPKDTLKILNIEPSSPFYSDIFLQNPISNAYSLMRPTMVYSVLSCLAYNYSVNNQNLALFELGRVYLRNESCDTGCKEFNTLSLIICGNRIDKGWGISQEIKYDFYDLSSVVKKLFNCFGQEMELRSAVCPFLEGEVGFEIIINGTRAGIVGKINKNMFLELIPNVKLLRDSVFYCEIFMDSFKDIKKTLIFESKFPPILRLYNFVCPKNVRASEILNTIKNSGEAVQECVIKDLYNDKKMEKTEHSLLFEVVYRLKERTLVSEDVEAIERLFLQKLKEKFDVYLKN
jgi:phenylalanyl-tRNA synthetase beta chain